MLTPQPLQEALLVRLALIYIFFDATSINFYSYQLEPPYQVPGPGNHFRIVLGYYCLRLCIYKTRVWSLYINTLTFVNYVSSHTHHFQNFYALQYSLIYVYEFHFNILSILQYQPTYVHLILSV